MTINELIKKIENSTATKNQIVQFFDHFEDVKSINLSKHPIWLYFLNDSNSDSDILELCEILNSKGGNIFERNKYGETIFHFRLERLKNRRLITETAIKEIFCSLKDVNLVEKEDKSLWYYCFYYELTEKEILNCLKLYHDCKGDLLKNGNTGTIFHYAARISSVDIWEFAKSVTNLDSIGDYIENHIWDTFVIDANDDLHKRIEFTKYIIREKIPHKIWGLDTLLYAMRDEDESLFNLIIESGFHPNPDDYWQVLTGTTNKKFLKKLNDLGIHENQESFDSETEMDKVITNRIIIECSDKSIELEFENNQPDWEDLYNSLEIIHDKEPNQYEENGIQVGHIVTDLKFDKVVKLIVEDAGLISDELSQILHQNLSN